MDTVRVTIRRSGLRHYPHLRLPKRTAAARGSRKWRIRGESCRVRGKSGACGGIQLAGALRSAVVRVPFAPRSAVENTHVRSNVRTQMKTRTHGVRTQEGTHPGLAISIIPLKKTWKRSGKAHISIMKYANTKRSVSRGTTVLGSSLWGTVPGEWRAPGRGPCLGLCGRGGSRVR